MGKSFFIRETQKHGDVELFFGCRGSINSRLFSFFSKDVEDPKEVPLIYGEIDVHGVECGYVGESRRLPLTNEISNVHQVSPNSAGDGRLDSGITKV